MKRKSELLFGSLIGLLMTAPGAEVLAQASQLNIAEVAIDYESDTIVIIGERFDIVRTITLGDRADLGDITEECSVDTSLQPHTITCTLADGLPAPGDYRLTLSRNPAQRDSYDLTIGSRAVAIESCPEGSAIREVDEDGSVVCETVDAGVSVDSCPAGSAIREINDDGSVVCEFVGGEASSLFISQQSIIISGPDFGVTGTASCSPGGTLINGGYVCPGITANFAVNASHPVSPTTWEVKFSNAATTNVQCLIIAQCSYQP